MLFIRLTLAVAAICALSVAARAVYMFDHPISIAFDKSDNLIVAETGRYRVDKYDNVLNRNWRSGSLTPQHLAVDGNGDIYVANYLTGVKKISGVDGSFMPLAAPLANVANAVSVAVDGNNFVYVLDGHTGLMQKFTPDGSRQLGSWGGTIGSGDGEFSSPTDIAVGTGGVNIYIADSGNHRIQRWHLTIDPQTNKVTGATVVGWQGRCASRGIRSNCDFRHQVSRGFTCTAQTCGSSLPGSGNGQFIYPSGLGLGPGFVYVADFGNSRVQKFDANGVYLQQFGKNGIGPGQLIEPSDVAVDSVGNVWVSDGAAGRIVEFSASGSPLRIFGGREILAASPGLPPVNVDPIFDPRAVVLFANSMLNSTITLASFGYSGALTMTPSCCLDMATSAPANSSGISLTLSPQNFTFAPPQAPGTAALQLTSSSSPAGGNFIAQVTIADPAQNFSDQVGVGFTALPPWPADGPPPACMPGLQVLPLSMLDLFAFRKPLMTAPSVFTSGVGIKSADSHCAPTGECAGFDLNLTGSPGLRSDLTVITFKNSTHSGYVNVTSSDSNNCSASFTIRVPQGVTLPLILTKASTTTLIFSDASGNIPVAKAQFSEGPFWSFFGGRAATINFIGDWRF